MRRKLFAAVMAVLVASLATVAGGANPALASDRWVDQLPWPAVPPPGYVAPDGYTTVAPVNCYFSYLGTRDYLTGGYTECMRQPGLHRAAVLCADGTIKYAFTEEMDYGLQARVECGYPLPWEPHERAIAAWGEYHLDVW